MTLGPYHAILITASGADHKQRANVSGDKLRVIMPFR
jgi:hypothetical protein